MVEMDDSSNFHLDVPSPFLIWAPATAYRKYWWLLRGARKLVTGLWEATTMRSRWREEGLWTTM